MENKMTLAYVGSTWGFVEYYYNLETSKWNVYYNIGNTNSGNQEFAIQEEADKMFFNMREELDELGEYLGDVEYER